VNQRSHRVTIGEGIGEIGEAVEVLAVGDELEELRAEKALSVVCLTWRVQRACDERERARETWRETA